MNNYYKWLQGTQQEKQEKQEKNNSNSSIASFITSTLENTSPVAYNYTSSIFQQLLSPSLLLTANNNILNETEKNLQKNSHFGLENFGNTCYCNSILQSLFVCKPFRDRVFTSSQQSLTTSPDNLLSCLKDLFVTIFNQKKGFVSPKVFIQKLRQENELFRVPVHHDAHEFFNYLLNAICDILIKQNEFLVNLEMNQREIENVDEKGEILEEDVLFGSIIDFSKVKLKSEEIINPSPPLKIKTLQKSWINELFEGVLANEIKCKRCESISQRTEPFLDLSIDIPKDNCSITSCLKHFSKPELLTGREKFFCSVCCSLQEAEKRMKIKTLPRILTLHLKRFKYIEKLQRHIKLTQRVSFPLTLKLSQQTLLPGSGDYLYRLYAVVVHIGLDPSHGHYVSIVKSMNKWWVFDDTFVEEVEENFIARVFGWGSSENEHNQNSSKGYGSMFNVGGAADDYNFDESKASTSKLKSPSTNSLNSSNSLAGKSILQYGCGYILFYEAISSENK